MQLYHIILRFSYYRVVINYDFPTGIEDYVHRIGRTGRAGATGVAYTFFTEQDGKYAADLIKVLEGANQCVPPEVREMTLCGGPGLGKDRGRVSRFDAGNGGGGHWDSGGQGGMKDGGFGRGGMRDGGFGGRGGARDGSFSGRGGPRDGAFGAYEGRSDMFPGRRNRGRGFGRPGGGNAGWGRNDPGPRDRYGNMDGRRRGRFDNRRDIAGRSSRGRSCSRSPDRFRTWGYSNRSRSRSSRSSRSWSRSRSRSRSRSQSRSCGHSRSRSRSRSRDRYERPRDQKDRRVSGFDVLPESQMLPMIPAAPMSPGFQGHALPTTEPVLPGSEQIQTFNL